MTTKGVMMKWNDIGMSAKKAIKGKIKDILKKTYTHAENSSISVIVFL